MAARPRKRPTHCKHCHRSTKECGQISFRGACEECGIRRMTETVTQIAEGEGPEYERWREATARGLARYAQELLAN